MRDACSAGYRASCAARSRSTPFDIFSAMLWLRGSRGGVGAVHLEALMRARMLAGEPMSWNMAPA